MCACVLPESELISVAGMTYVERDIGSVHAEHTHVIRFHIQSKNIAVLYENCLQLCDFLVFIRH